MKVKKLGIDDVREDGVYVAKFKGSFDNGSVAYKPKKGNGNLLIGGKRLRAFGFIYKLEDNIDVVVRKPKDTNEWPRWNDKMDKLNGHKLSIEPSSIEEYEEGGVIHLYVMVSRDGDEFGVSIDWLEPASVPEFKTKTAAYMFHEVEIALPKKPLALSEIKLLDNASIKKAAEKVKGKAGTANWVAIHPDGSMIGKFGAACHFDLRGQNHRGCQYIVTQARVKSVEEKWWAYYLTNLSPLKDCFLLKDVDSIVELDAYILGTDQPSNAVGMACIATRQPWEYTARVKGFCALCKAGIPCDLAFIAAHLCDTCGDTMSFNQTHSGHGVIPAERMENKHVVNFLTGKFDKANKPFVENNDYGGTDNLFGNGNLSKASFAKAIRSIGGEVNRYGDRNPLATKEAIAMASSLISEWCADNL